MKNKNIVFTTKTCIHEYECAQIGYGSINISKMCLIQVLLNFTRNSPSYCMSMTKLIVNA